MRSKGGRMKPSLPIINLWRNGYISATDGVHALRLSITMPLLWLLTRCASLFARMRAFISRGGVGHFRQASNTHKYYEMSHASPTHSLILLEADICGFEHKKRRYRKGISAPCFFGSVNKPPVLPGERKTEQGYK